MSNEELKLLWHEIHTEGCPYIQAIYKLLMLTAQRSGEVKGMKWEEIDFDTKTWTIPGERTKNGLSHTVPLAPAALRILESLKAGR